MIPDKFASPPNIDGTPYATTIGYQGGHTLGDTLMMFGNVSAIGFGFSMDNGEAFSAPNHIPVPAAIWLFGTGILGLIGFSQRGVIAKA